MDSETKICPYCREEIKAEAKKCRWCRSSLPLQSSGHGEWYRDLPGRRFLGVASVLALNTGMSVMVWRILFLILLPFDGVSLLIYFAVWALTPFRPDGQSLFDRIFRSARYSRTKT